MKLDLNQFEQEVDEYFLCGVCGGVAVEPQECSECESLYCTECGQVTENCPECLASLTLRKTSRYALQVYNSLSASCVNTAKGCHFHSKLNQLIEHQGVCQYQTCKCANPLCNKTFRKLERYSENPIVCSDLCKNIVDFQSILQAKDENAILYRFHLYLRDTKSNMLAEVTEKLQKEIEKCNISLEEEKTFEKQKEEILNEIELRKSSYHHGKWNKHSKYWTCCLTTDQLDIGCKALTQ